MPKFIKMLFSIIICFLFVSTASANEFEINSSHAILYNLDDGTILYEKKADEQTYVASLTKIMTTIVAIENIDNLNEKVTLTPNVFTGLAEANASVAGFKIGQKVTYMDLLMGTMLPSGADAARGLAINLSGSEKEFVKLMNKKAKDLNLKNTNFVNITGLDATNHYSSVKDIAIILQYALQNPTFKQIYTTREYKTTTGLMLNSTLKKISKNTSIDISNILGTKTGTTGKAGLCLSSIANYKGINYMLVTTGATSKSSSPLQLLDAITIYNYYSSNYDYHNIVNKDEFLTQIPIEYNYKKHYNVTATDSISKYLSNDFNKENVTYRYTGLTKLSYKNNVQNEIGKIEIIYNNEVLETIPVYLNEKIGFCLIPFLIQTKIIYIIILIVVICISTLILKKKTRILK